MFTSTEGRVLIQVFKGKRIVLQWHAYNNRQGINLYLETAVQDDFLLVTKLLEDGTAEDTLVSYLRNITQASGNICFSPAGERSVAKNERRELEKIAADWIAQPAIWDGIVKNDPPYFQKLIRARDQFIFFIDITQKRRRIEDALRKDPKLVAAFATLLKI